jgi:hypothetical protein
MSTLSKALRLYYRTNETGVRELAAKWDTSSSTVSRFLSGKPIETQTFLRILNILMEGK